jgi:hypothetical protein
VTDVQDEIPSPLPSAEEMVEAGAAPTTVDVNGMLAQIQALQARVDKMQGEQPAPVDEVAKAVADLTAHVKARAVQNPAIDFTEALSVLGNIPKLGEDVKPSHTDYAKTLLHDLADKFQGRELGYIKELATAAHLSVLKAVV